MPKNGEARSSVGLGRLCRKPQRVRVRTRDWRLLSHVAAALQMHLKRRLRQRGESLVLASGERECGQA